MKIHKDPGESWSAICCVVVLDAVETVLSGGVYDKRDSGIGTPNDNRWEEL